MNPTRTRTRTRYTRIGGSVFSDFTHALITKLTTLLSNPDHRVKGAHSNYITYSGHRQEGYGYNAKNVCHSATNRRITILMVPQDPSIRIVDRDTFYIVLEMVARQYNITLTQYRISCTHHGHLLTFRMTCRVPHTKVHTPKIYEREKEKALTASDTPDQMSIS